MLFTKPEEGVAAGVKIGGDTCPFDGVVSERCKSGGDEQAEMTPAAKASTIKIKTRGTRKRFMIYILLEAFLAGMILVVIVWWTMFSNRPGGEVKPEEKSEHEGAQSQDATKKS